jgi:Kef-type K+ transport system membrane component KefB
MSNQDLGHLALAMMLLMAGAHLLGQLFARVRQPKVIGEILAGVLLGPSVLGHFAPGVMHNIFGADKSDPKAVGLSFLYNLGLLLLMFVSGSSVRHVLGGENKKPTLILFAIGTTTPFLLAMLCMPFLPLDQFMGTADSRWALILIFSVSVAVTSIPVITKIFSDLGILHTRFASLMLGSAVLEDIALWGVATVATALAAATASGSELTREIIIHVAWNAGFVLAAMTVMPKVLRWLGQASWNSLAQKTPLAWVMTVMLGYVAFAAAYDINLAFAAFLAGFGIVGGMKSTERHTYRFALDSIGAMSAGVFVPLYFAIIGFRLDFTKTFNLWMLVAFLVGSSIIKISCLAGASRVAGFRGTPVLNLAITSNARGGPGIVLASVAFDAGIINAPFFTTLVLTAVLTSQLCGFWLHRQLQAGKSLLGDSEQSEANWSKEETSALNGTSPLEHHVV